MAFSQIPDRLTVLVTFTFDRHARIDALRALTERLSAIPHLSRIVELEGASDLMIEAQVECLSEFHDLIERSIDPHRRFISRYETHFVLRTTQLNDPHNLLWTADRDHSRCVDLDRAECVSAEGDYVRIRVDGHGTLIHSTLQSILHRLPQPPFVQIHRSTIVNAAAVRQIVRDGRRWQVELTDGSVHPIAKGRHGEVARNIATAAAVSPASSTPNPSSRPVGPFERTTALVTPSQE